jgi:hypothetical protein
MILLRIPLDLFQNTFDSEGKAVPQHTTEAQGERRCSFYTFTTSALDEGEWLASRPDHALPPGKGPRAPTALYLRGKDPGTHCTGGCVGPRAGLDTEARGNPLALRWDQTSITQLSSP